MFNHLFFRFFWIFMIINSSVSLLLEESNHQNQISDNLTSQQQRQLLVDRQKYNPFHEFTVNKYYHTHICNQNDTRVICGLGSWSEQPQLPPSACDNFQYDEKNCCNVSRVFTHQNGKPGNGSMHTILKHWRNKKITFAGDSITHQTFHSLLTSLRIFHIDFQFASLYYECLSNSENHHNCQLMDKDYYCNINFQYTQNRKRHRNNQSDSQPSVCNAVDKMYIPKYNITIHNIFYYVQEIPKEYYPRDNYLTLNYLSYRLFEDFVKKSDSMIVNIGAHYQHRSATLYYQILRYYRHILEVDLEDNPNKKHIFRLTFPGHAGINSAYELRTDHLCVLDAIPTWTYELAKNAMGEKVYILDYYDVMKSQGDLHYRNRKNDCLHWCYLYELFYPFYQLITKIYNPNYNFE